jgi:hypothetical protein
MLTVRKSVLLEAYRTDVAEGKSKLERLSEKMAEMDEQMKENEQAIEDAQRKIQLHKNSTRASVFRLKGKLFACSSSFTSVLIEKFPYAFKMNSIRCKPSIPGVQQRCNRNYSNSCTANSSSSQYRAANTDQPCSHVTGTGPSRLHASTFRLPQIPREQSTKDATSFPRTATTYSRSRKSSRRDCRRSKGRRRRSFIRSLIYGRPAGRFDHSLPT